jgi:hypothetical protein
MSPRRPRPDRLVVMPSNMAVKDFANLPIAEKASFPFFKV